MEGEMGGLKSLSLLINASFPAVPTPIAPLPLNLFIPSSLKMTPGKREALRWAVLIISRFPCKDEQGHNFLASIELSSLCEICVPPTPAPGQDQSFATPE